MGQMTGDGRLRERRGLAGRGDRRVPGAGDGRGPGSGAVLAVVCLGLALSM
ncbi:MAG TPA: hypothetical protein VIL16_28365 [Trebonia sp.]|jgi:hypothetical protein